MSAPVPLGSVVAPWGKVAAYHLSQDGRFYHLVSEDGLSVSVLPADVVEPRYREQRRPE